MYKAACLVFDTEIHTHRVVCNIPNIMNTSPCLAKNFGAQLMSSPVYILHHP